MAIGQPRRRRDIADLAMTVVGRPAPGKDDRISANIHGEPIVLHLEPKPRVVMQDGVRHPYAS